MPGLVCVLGRDRAVDLARAAARPLLRRPWQTLELAPTRDDVALGFAGERGGVAHDPETGVALAFDGETFGEGGALAGAQAVQELLGGYLAAGADVKLPQGAFAAAVWPDERRSVPLGCRLGIARHQDPQRHVGENLRARKHDRRDDDEPDDERVPVIPAGEASPHAGDPLSAPRAGQASFGKPRASSGE